MATDLRGELEAFHRFIGDKLGSGGSPISLEHALQEFRAYQRDLRRFREDTQQSLEESARGESSPLDIDDVVERGRLRLGKKGMTDR
jgi:hypothetical protein